jgi:hypothetical protein
MEKSTLEKKLESLLEEIGAYPTPYRRKMLHLTRRSRRDSKRVNNDVSSIQSSLDHLRISVKYLVFDLEATRRENTYLKKLLDQKE